MMKSVRRRRQKRKEIFGMIGIIAIFIIAGTGYYFIQSNTDALDEYQCSIKNGPNEVTAIIFDKSQAYTNDQVVDIKTSFNLWLAGKESNIKDRPIDLDIFREGNLVQLYVTDQESLDKTEGLSPIAQLCVPKDFRDANEWIENPAFLKKNYDKFISTFSSTIESLTEQAEGKSPIMETFLRISNSESFQSYSDKPHNLLVISDMLQHSDNYSHYKSTEGPSWNVFEKKLGDTVYTKIRLKNVEVQIFWAKRQSERDKKLQTKKLVDFWSEFFNEANAEVTTWILMYG